MTEVSINIEAVSKLYKLGEFGTGTISHDLNRWWQTQVLGNEDPYAKIGTINIRSQKAKKHEYVWALKNINLNIKKGEIVGILGKNGAGKSTLLKLLSRVTSPTIGTIRIDGKMSSLLEVGTGFHPEMTGRENIYMNGTIMGMSKFEVSMKLDEIVEFSGISKYLDTPTKRYSSGMTVRLGFAIAAFLEPDILVVDEVLAVGDAEFQKRAIGKMKDITTDTGRTVLFVSHNMLTLNSLCDTGILIEDGTIGFQGSISQTIGSYMKTTTSTVDFDKARRKGSGEIIVYDIEFKQREKTVEFLVNGDDAEIVFHYRKQRELDPTRVTIGVYITNSSGIKVCQVNNFATNQFFNSIYNIGAFALIIKNLPLLAGEYMISYSVMINFSEFVDHIEGAKSMEIIEGDFYGTGKTPRNKDYIFHLNSDFDNKNLENEYK